MKRATALCLLLCLAGLAFADKPQAPAPPLAASQVQFFESKIRPLLAARCFKCHGSQKQNNGLRLDSAAGVRTGGDSGPVVVAGKPEESLLIKAINYELADGPKMPPKEKLKPEEIAILTEWVKQGAHWPDAQGLPPLGVDIGAARKSYWAFQPIRSPAPPAVKDAAWPLNDIERFVLAQLDANGLQPVEPADKRTLIRRATYDLIGLPPTPEEIDAFLADDSPEAFARVIERLLSSPHYGERWGRHWLDLVRYADTAGENSDYPIPQMYKYRNWVIQAFNDDKPYDQFLREQIAGDLIGDRQSAIGNRPEKAEPTADLIIATGYLANARRFGSVVDGYPWHLTIEDTIDNLGRTVLGLTINCARCHDHKFDPVTSEDYYALYGFFQNTRYPWPGIELDKVQRDLVPLVAREKATAVLKERESREKELGGEVKQLEAEKARLEKALKEAESLQIGDERAYRVATIQSRLKEVEKALQAARKEKELIQKRPLPFETAYAVADGIPYAVPEGMKKEGNARVHLRGDPEKLGKEAPRRFLAVLGGQPLSGDVKGSGRLELANWLTDPHNPLTARVMVNRVWQHHFGKGIVPTPSDFGKQGRPPTHPELLDFLARRFIDGGWSVKSMHRLIMLSRTYQLSSRDEPANLQKDPANDYLWRFNRRRLDAEAIRDTLLAVSGALDRTPGAGHPFPEQTTWDFTQHKPFKAVYDSNKRSVYLMTQRIQRHPFLSLFDGPDTNASTARRVTSTTPLQALYFMNDPFVHEQAKRLAARLLGQMSEDVNRIQRAFVMLYGRPASSEEVTQGREYLESVREKLGQAGVPSEKQPSASWESYVRALFLSNEFVYVD